MALLDSEVDRIKFELGYNMLNVGAEPYIGVAAIFSQVIQVYLRAGASTTSTTSVSAATAATPATLTLASPTGFAAGARVVIDVDDRQEEATVQSLSGSSMVVLLKLAHSGTYPVTVEGGESVVRGILKRLRTIQDLVAGSAESGGVKVADEVEFFGPHDGGDRFQRLVSAQSYWRKELCRALFGVGSLSELGGGGGRRISVY